MTDVAQRDDQLGPDVGSESRLAPLPKRVGAPLAEPTEGESSMALVRAPRAHIDELLERAAALLATLDHDEAGLDDDEHAERLRIEADQARRRAEAQQARQQIEHLHHLAEKIAQAKGKTALLDQGRHGLAPVDDSIDFVDLLTELRTEVKAAKGITGAIRLPHIGELLRQADAVVVRLGEEAEGLRERRLSDARDERDAETKEARASFEIGTMILNRDIGLLEAALPPAGRSWGNEGWADWTPPAATEPTAGWVRFGAFTHDELEADIPMLLEFPTTQTLVIDSVGRHEEAVAGVQSLLLRIAAALPPGAVRFTIVDPKGLGQSAAPLLGLAEFDRELIDDGVATTPDEIEKRITALTHHAERVLTHYLRGAHRSLADFHAAAGEIVEPYRVLVVFDHPSQLNESATTQLAALAENGPRGGVQTILVKDATPSYSSYQAQPPGDALTMRMDGSGYFLDVPNAGRWTVALDQPPAPEIIDRIIDAVGTGAARHNQSDLTLGQLFDVADRAARAGRARKGSPGGTTDLDLEDPSTWWRESSADGIATPIGRQGPAAVATLDFGPARPGYLVVGRPGSGVSSSLHTAIVGLALRYAPDQLQLHLLGMGAGRELLGFGELGLPHAEVVASGADHEFGVGALDTIWTEVERRQTLIAESVGERAGYAAHRSDHPHDLPRVLVVIERFGELFEGPRRQVQRAGELLDSVARFGPACGVHLLLTTSPDDERTIGAGGMLAEPTPGSVTPAVVNLRGLAALDVIALGPTGDGDAVGDEVERDGVQILHRAGDGVLRRRTTGAGPEARSNPFRGAFVDPAELTICLHDLRRLADAPGPAQGASDGSVDDGTESDGRGKVAPAGGGARWPQVHDGHAVARVEQRHVLDLVGDPQLREARRMPRLWLGEPIGTGRPVEAVVHRRDGANLLAVTPDPDVGQGIIVSAMLSALLVHGENLGILALDFMPPEAGFTEATKALAAGTWTVQLARRRNITKVVDVIHRVVQDRLATSQTRGKPVLFVMNGLSRARDLDVASDGETHPDDEHLLGIIEAVLRDGPEVGVHTLAWCESLAALHRRLPKSAVREFALRVAGPMEPEESMAFIDTEQGGTIRANEALFADEDSGQLVKMRPYTLPTTKWLTTTVAQATAE